MQKDIHLVSAYLEAHEEEMIDFWEKLVNMEGRFDESVRLIKVAEMLKAVFEGEGFICDLFDAGAEIGQTLVGTLGSERTGKPILFSGHYDTVFKSGLFGNSPFRIEAGRAYGPGVLDMKGGIVVTLYVIKALNHIGFDRVPLKIVFVGDEENAHLFSTTKDILNEQTKKCLFAFNMETGRDDNKLCVGRKGNCEYIVTTHGVSSHPGNHFELGINAIEEMAHKIIDFQRLTADLNRYTVSVGTVKGGTVSNVIPDSCTIKIDVRFDTLKDCRHIEERINEICNRVYVKGTTTDVSCSLQMLPYETTDDVIALYDHVARTAIQYGLPAPGQAKMGGASDAAYITIAGTPVLCACGVRGSGSHTKEEFGEVKSLIERALLISMAIIHHEDFNAG